MKTHFITSDVPLEGRYEESVCKKPCEIFRHIPTDLDLQDLDLRTLTKCKTCASAKLKRYTYISKQVVDADQLRNE